MNINKTVCLFVPRLDGGGAEKVAINLAHGLARIGLEVHLVVAQAAGDYLQTLASEESFELVDLNAKFPLLIYKTLALKRYLQQRQPDYLISILDILGAAVIARQLAGVKTKVVMTIHTNLSQQFKDRHGAAVTAFKWFCISRMYPQADAIAAVSKGVAADVSANSQIALNTIRVLYNPILTQDFHQQIEAPIPHPWLAPNEPPVILGVGRLVKQKDFTTLVRAFAEVRKHQPVRLIILGGEDKREPNIKPQLQSLVQDLGLSADIALLGFVSNPYSYMANAKTFALSSIYEGFGNVIVEALAAGTPVVSTDCESGPAEILEAGLYGKLVPVKNFVALAEGIRNTLLESHDANRLRQRAALFSVDKVASEYCDFLYGL